MLKNLRVNYVVEGVQVAQPVTSANSEVYANLPPPVPAETYQTDEDYEEDDGGWASSEFDDYDEDEERNLITLPPPNKKDEEKKNELEIPLHDKLAYNTRWVDYKIEEARRWIKIIPLYIIFWSIFLITVASLYTPYIEQCEPDGTLSEFSMVILSYIILQRILDLILAAVSLKGLKRVKEDETLDRIAEVKNLQPTEEQEKKLSGTARYEDAEPLSMKRTALLGKRVLEYKAVTKAASYNATTSAATGAAHISREGVKRAFANLRHGASKVFNNRVKKFKLPHLPKPTTFETGVHYLNPPRQLERNTVGFGGRFLMSLNVIPVFSILFFVVIGVDTMGEIQRYQSSLTEHGHTPALTDLPVVCKASYGVNLTIICLIFLQAVSKFIPVFFRVIASAEDPKTYKQA